MEAFLFMPIIILLETPDFLVINKPAGLRTHSDGKSKVPTVVEWILREHPGIVGVGENMEIDGKVIERPGIVHRLDEETSGALIIAKTQEAFVFLKQQFKERNVQKEYHAFVWGHFKESLGTVDAPIGRSSGDFRRWQAGRGIRGEVREAVTKWEAIEQFEDEQAERFSFMHLWPKTGRTHQLRVHMKYLQRPIVSDSLYGGKRALGFERVALHARTITFSAPSGGEITVTAPYPADFAAAIGRYCKIA
ncbi:RluA family pseudouridine synthase [Candidatus Nomurabacteria bacterium]|nr:RluA family pseudouridine synthase [Candidatus Nomurabacteria bacterium]